MRATKRKGPRAANGTGAFDRGEARLVLRQSVDASPEPPLELPAAAAGATRCCRRWQGHRRTAVHMPLFEPVQAVAGDDAVPQ